MNEKKFHKIIEETLTQEERQQKQKTYEKIISKTQCKTQEKPKRTLKLLPLATTIALICIMIPLSIFLVLKNGEAGHLVEGSASSTSMLATDEFFPSIPYQEYCPGVIVNEGNKKFFQSIDGNYRFEILETTIIEDYNSEEKIKLDDITSDCEIFALIVTENNKHNYPEYQVGDMVKLKVKKEIAP